jgi:hypothetical protein
MYCLPIRKANSVSAAQRRKQNAAANFTALFFCSVFNGFQGEMENFRKESSDYENVSEMN